MNHRRRRSLTKRWHQMQTLYFVLFQCQMMFNWRRMFRRHRFATLSSFVILLLVFRHSDWFIRLIFSEENSNGRLYCILIFTDPLHLRFLDYKNISWIEQCSNIGIVKYRSFEKFEQDSNPSRSPYHVGLWTRILTALRQSISSYRSISPNDTLMIVPATSYVFPKKFIALFQQSVGAASSLPWIFIYEQDYLNGYLVNGLALERLRHSGLLESCLERTYASAREPHLWKCVKYNFRREYPEVPCENNQCFVYTHRPLLTLGHIKNGSCLQDQHVDQCRSIALLHPITLSDLITLEFFKYRLKPKPLHSSL